MKFYTDGSRINLHNNDPYIGWGAVYEGGVLVQKGQKGGTNINAEIFAIRDLLQNLLNYRKKLIDQIDTIKL